MIKVCQQTKEIIAAATKYCSLIKIESVLIDKSGIRAKNEESAVYVIEPNDFDFLEFDKIFINRVDAFTKRLKMFESSKIDYDILVDVKESDGETYAARSVIKGGNTQVEIRCGNPDIVVNGRWPKKFNDEIFYKLNIDPEELSIIKRGISAMGADTFEVYSEDGNTVKIKITDVEGDVLSNELSSPMEALSDSAEKVFGFSYAFKTAMPLLSQCASENSDIKISKMGVMCLKVSGIGVYVFPTAKV